MSAPTLSEVRPLGADVLTVSDLMILDFDYWVNPKSAMVSPTTFCSGCGFDLAADSAE